MITRNAATRWPGFDHLEGPRPSEALFRLDDLDACGLVRQRTGDKHDLAIVASGYTGTAGRNTIDAHRLTDSAFDYSILGRVLACAIVHVREPTGGCRGHTGERHYVRGRVRCCAIP